MLFSNVPHLFVHQSQYVSVLDLSSEHSCTLIPLCLSFVFHLSVSSHSFSILSSSKSVPSSPSLFVFPQYFIFPSSHSPPCHHCLCCYSTALLQLKGLFANGICCTFTAQLLSLHHSQSVRDSVQHMPLRWNKPSIT